MLLVGQRATGVLLVILRLGVSSDDTFVVAQNYFVRALGDDVLGHDGNLAATAGSIHHEGRYTVAGGVSAKVFDDLDTLGNGCAEVFETHGEVALVYVVRTHAHAHEVVHELLHDPNHR